MSLFDTITSFIPFFKRSVVSENTSITLDELTLAIESYKAAVDLFGKNRFKNKAANDLATAYSTALAERSRAGFLEDIYDRLVNAKENLEYVQKESDRVLESDIITEGLTARKLALIQASDYIAFVCRYSVDILNYLYILESESQEDDRKLPPAKLKYLEENLLDFGRLMTVVGCPKKDFEKLLDDLPEVVVNTKSLSMVEGTYGEAKLNPFVLKTTRGFRGTPVIYQIGLKIAEWQASRYKASQYKKQLLEYRKLQLEQERNGTPNPALERQIQVLQDRIDDLEFYMHKMEESVA